MQNKKLHLTLNSRLEELDRLAGAIESFCIATGAEGHAAEYMLCADELFTNIIVHGLCGKSGHRIDVELCRDGPRFTVAISDDAPAFDPTLPTEPDLGASVEDRSIGGLGRYFVSTTMNTFCYRREQGRNHVEFGRVIVE